MPETIVEWIVEEVKRNGTTNTIKFTSYDEALDLYNHMKTENTNSNITIQKSEKKFLVG
jgi:hypothetical protein